MGGLGGKGPSPLIPSLIISLLIVATCGPILMNSATFLSGVEDTTVSFVFVIPLLSMLMIYFVSDSVIVPLVLLLLVYFLGRMVMGPLILLLIIHVLSSLFPTYQGGPPRPPPRPPSSYSFSTSYSTSLGVGGGGCCSGNEGEGYGWGSFWLLLVFLVLLKMYS